MPSYSRVQNTGVYKIQLIFDIVYLGPNKNSKRENFIHYKYHHFT